MVLLSSGTYGRLLPFSGELALLILVFSLAHLYVDSAIYLLGALCGRGECPKTSDYDFDFEVVRIFFFLIFTSIFFYVLALYASSSLTCKLSYLLIIWLASTATSTLCFPSSTVYQKNRGSSLIRWYPYAADARTSCPEQGTNFRLYRIFSRKLIIILFIGVFS